MKQFIKFLPALMIAVLAGCGSLKTHQQQTVTMQKVAEVHVASTTKATSPPVVTSTSVVKTTIEQKKTVSTVPSSFMSLQPFKKFKKGEGEGVALSYFPRTKAQFVSLLRDPKLAKKEMRVACDVLVRQMVEAHPGLPFEGCEGAAAAIEHNDDFTVVACEDKMFLQDNWLAVTDAHGKSFGVWHRKCLPNEKVLVYKDQSLISTTCLNVVVPVVMTVPATSIPAPVLIDTSSTITKACPKGIILFSNAWDISVFPSDLQERTEKLIGAAIDRDSENATKMSAYKADDFSRTLGDEIIRRVNVRATVDVDIHVRLLDPVTLKIVQDLGAIHLVDGIVPILLTEWQRTNIVETIWPAYFSSPTMSGGERRLWFFPDEWLKKTTTGRWCTMQEHGAFYNKNKP